MAGRFRAIAIADIEHLRNVQRAIEGRASDFEHPRHMRGAVPDLEHLSGGLEPRGIEDWATADVLATTLLSGQRVSGAFPDQLALEIGEGREDMEHEPAGGRRRIDRLGEALESDATLGEIVDGRNQMGH